ncbi:MbnP family copper-binding protein [Cystobacter ferrugineus]|uniref:Metallo-mystery pair system four-Cys motif protein n=1 Tax=Cystobacter ferrugineus TaxID=83449 RepID=A0A1L9BKD8_9BACT|nr:MbnP family copper-binding protein [Cystobacter ferrugineus]OJH42675.1 metallo-mystery pair system four-Cys motif protein [Cystobacter ferrugineus]
MNSSPLRFIAIALPLASSLGCGVQEPEKKELPVNISFEARVGAQPFACGRTYTGLGTTATTFEPMDFRLFLHDVRLVSEDGTEVPVALTDDGEWQAEGALLLDFADKSGQCTKGTAATRTHLVGTVPEGNYRGLRFKVGLPESLNHRNPMLAPTTFKDTSLYWGWRSGYIFARIDGRTTGLRSGYVMHLGSMDCPPAEPGQPYGRCTFPSLPEISLEGFVLDQSKVILDLASLLAEANLDADANVPNTSIGCMSQREDPDCAPVFNRLGLPFRDLSEAVPAQTFIRLE